MSFSPASIRKHRFFSLLARLYMTVSTNRYLSTTAVFVVFFLLFSYSYLWSSLLASSDDHFFHFRFASLIRENGFFESFSDLKALYFSKITEGLYYPYYNFLFYVFIVPFTYFDPLAYGIRLYAVVAASVFFTTLFVAASYFRVRYAFFGAVALYSIIGIEPLWRLLLSRPYVLAPVFLIVLILFLHKRNYLGVGIVSFLYLFWYSATFFLPPIIALAYCFFEHVYVQKAQWRGAVVALSGTIAAVLFTYLISPGFLLFIHDIVLANVLTLGRGVHLPEGAELYPGDIINYVQQNSVLFAALIIATGFEVYTYFTIRQGRAITGEAKHGHAHVRATLIFLAAGFFAAAMLVTGRFKDYILLFFGLYLILSFSELRTHVHIPDQRLRRYIAAATLLALTYLCFTNTLSLRQFIAYQGAPVETFAGVGGWINSHVPSGSVVFNPTWNWFPQLYYYSPETYYITGLEPRFLYEYSPSLFWKWINISNNGFVCATEECPNEKALMLAALKSPSEKNRWYASSGEEIANTILEDFQSEYIVSSYQFTSLNAVLDHSDRFEKVYGGNRTYYVYHVLHATGH